MEAHNMSENGSTAMQVAGLNALTVQDVKAHVDLVREVMQKVMKRGPDYDTIPGCGDKPALLKSGAEKLCVTFRLAPEIIVEDLSNQDEKRFRTRVRLVHQGTGQLIAEGIGECSSDEEKYKWKKAFNEQEFNATTEDRKRLKWKRGYGTKPEYQEKQIRTNPADVANTILKMSKKRGLVDAVLSGTAASDLFTQDIEENPEMAAHNESGKSAPVGAPAGGKQTKTFVPKLVREKGEEHRREENTLEYRVAGRLHLQDI
jgi:hypothetical protein